jgi:RNA-directed DNA polymerase
MRLSEEKTKIVHIDEGFDFLGWHLQRQRKRGTEKRFVYTYPSAKALASVKAKVRTLTRGGTNQTLEDLLDRLNPVLRGWANFFKYGSSSRTLSYLRAFTWHRVICWLRHKHPQGNWKQLRRRYLQRWWPTQGKAILFDPASVAVTRYRFRGERIPSLWSIETTGSVA